MKGLDWNNAADVHLLLAAVKEDRLFIGSTDTVLGLMGRVSMPVKIQIDRLKVRSEKPYIVLVDSIQKVEKWCAVDEHIKRFLSSCWPGPVTVILPMRVGDERSKDTIAIRIPNHAGLLSLLKHIPQGLYSTSANISGYAVPHTIEDVASVIKEGCAYVIKDDSYSGNDCASTIIDCSQGDFKVVRSGAYAVEILQNLYNKALN